MKGGRDLEDILKNKTKFFWEEYSPSQLDVAMQWYITEKHKDLGNKSLLEAELEWARNQEGHITAQPCETLVLLVGFSLEPLLQSICVYQPQKIVLLLNEAGYPGETHESWDVFAQHIVEAVQHLVRSELLNSAPQIPGEDNHKGYPVADRPEAVFQRLVEILHNETDVVIDVTGGKKSMVTGAYLYAAYAGARISYVDFDEYNPEYRRPYGYSCKIGELQNPYKTFALREWERVRALYERYHFREAAVVLKKQVMPVMVQYLPDSEKPMKALVQSLDYYEKWDRGDYRGAKQSVPPVSVHVSVHAPVQFDQPTAVTELGDKWYEIKGCDFIRKPKRFYGDLNAVKVYVSDELARIRRLIEYNEDYRSAFLRAGGLNEIIMLARLVDLLPAGTDKDAFLDALDQRTPAISSIFRALLDPNKTTIQIGEKRGNIKFPGAPDIQITRQTPMNSWWQQKTRLFNDSEGWEVFLDIRNKLAHTYFSVPRELAEDALQFVQANFEDFLGHPVDDLKVKTEALRWSDLCQLCGLDMFLPPNLR